MFLRRLASLSMHIILRRILDWLQKNIKEVWSSKIRFYNCSFFNLHQSTKSLWPKVKDIGIGKPNTESPVNMDLNTVYNYTVIIQIDIAGAQRYAIKLNSVPMIRP